MLSTMLKNLDLILEQGVVDPFSPLSPPAWGRPAVGPGSFQEVPGNLRCIHLTVCVVFLLDHLPGGDHRECLREASLEMYARLARHLASLDEPDSSPLAPAIGLLLTWLSLHPDNVFLPGQPIGKVEEKFVEATADLYACLAGDSSGGPTAELAVPGCALWEDLEMRGFGPMGAFLATLPQDWAARLASRQLSADSAPVEETRATRRARLCQAVARLAERVQPLRDRQLAVQQKRMAHSENCTVLPPPSLSFPSPEPLLFSPDSGPGRCSRSC